MPDQSIRYTSDPNLPDSTLFFDSYTPYKLNVVNGGLDPFLSEKLSASAIQADTKKDSLLQTKSVFAQKDNQSFQWSSKPVEDQIPGWIPILLLIYLFILAAARNISGNRLSQLLKATFSIRYLHQLDRDTDILKEGNTLGFIAISILAAGITTVASIFYFTGNYVAFTPINLLLAAGGFLAFSILQILLILFTGKLMSTVGSSRSHILNGIVLAESAGVIMLPLTISFIYSQQAVLLFISLGIAALMFILRYVRIIIIGFNIRQYSLFYLILYLCTLEILPILLVLKIVENYT